MCITEKNMHIVLEKIIGNTDNRKNPECKSPGFFSF